MNRAILDYYARRQIRLDSRGIHMDYGTAASGNWGHVGRPGKRGGSQAGGGSGFRAESKTGKITVGGHDFVTKKYTSRAKIRQSAKETLASAKKALKEVQASGTMDKSKVRRAYHALDLAQTMYNRVNGAIKTADGNKAGKSGYQVVDYASPFSSRRRGDKTVHGISGAKSGDKKSQIEINTAVFDSIFSRTEEGKIFSSIDRTGKVESSTIRQMLKHNSLKSEGSGKLAVVRFGSGSGKATVAYRASVDGRIKRCDPRTGDFLETKSKQYKNSYTPQEFEKAFGGKSASISVLRQESMTTNRGAISDKQIATPEGQKAYSTPPKGKAFNFHGMSMNDRRMFRQKPDSRWVTEDGRVFGRKPGKDGEYFECEVKMVGGKPKLTGKTTPALAHDIHGSKGKMMDGSGVGKTLPELYKENENRKKAREKRKGK